MPPAVGGAGTTMEEHFDKRVDTGGMDGFDVLGTEQMRVRAP